MVDKPLVTVIIPVFNCENYLGDAIQAVLGQTYRPIEIIVVDDGSTDASSNVAKQYGSEVQYFFQQNSGAGAARNHGIKLAHGSFFSFLDADDLWLKNKLLMQLELFKKSNELDMVFGQVEQCYSPELEENFKKTIQVEPGIMPGYHAGTMLIKKDSFQRVGYFDEKLRMGEFIDWYSRAKDCGLKSVMCDEVVMKRRIHKNNMGIRDRSNQKQYLQLLRASLARRNKQSE